MTSHLRFTSASEAAAESVSPRSLLLSVWVLGALTTAWFASDLRDWLLEGDRARWAGQAADRVAALADQAGVSSLREQAESLRRALYGVSEAPPLESGVNTPAKDAPEVALASPTAHESAPRPTRALVIGASSIQFALGQALEQQLANYENLTVRRMGKASTGLSRPDAFNWPARLEQLLDEHTPDLVIVNFGGNDAQNIPLPNKQRADFGTAAWDTLYGQRVSEFVARIRARGAQAVVIGMPIMRSPKFSQSMLRLNAVTASATRAAGGIYLDQWDLSALPDGSYREYVPEGSKQRAMRLEDGIHYTDAGGRYVVARLLPRLERHVRLVSKDATLGVLERHTYSSASLNKRASYLAWLPRVRSGERVPLLVLLHGADSSPDEVAEHLHASLASAAQAERIAIVAPDGGAASWWLDSPVLPESRYASSIAKDLISDVRAHLPVNDARGVVGISMGGNGALLLALAHPGTFRSASSVSGAVDLTLAGDRPALRERLGPLDRERARWEGQSALHLLARQPESAQGVALRLSCGTKDRWLEANRALHARAEAAHVRHDYDETADAGHDWSYWSTILPAHVSWHARALAARP